MRINESLPYVPGTRYSYPAAAGTTRKSGADAAVLENGLDAGLKISRHAQKRLDERGLALGTSEMSQLSEAVDQLNEKGSQNSLLIYKDMALITSINNRTIITALDLNEVDTITNIDSTKIIKE